MADKLKPCPFCGKDAAAVVFWQSGWIAECKCGIRTMWYTRKDGAIRRWNKRAGGA